MSLGGVGGMVGLHGLGGLYKLSNSMILLCSMPAPPSLCPWLVSPLLPVFRAGESASGAVARTMIQRDRCSREVKGVEELLQHVSGKKKNF